MPGSCAPTNQRGTAGDTCTVGYAYLTGKGEAVRAGRASLDGGQSIIFAFKFARSSRGDGFKGRRTSRTARTSVFTDFTDFTDFKDFKVFTGFTDFGGGRVL